MTKRQNETRKVEPMPSLAENVLQRVANAPRKDRKGREVMLTPKEWAFVQEYVTRDGTMTRTEAAIRAGYTPSSAKDVIKRLIDPAKAPHVVAAINEYEEWGGTVRNGSRAQRQLEAVAAQRFPLTERARKLVLA